MKALRRILKLLRPHLAWVVSAVVFMVGVAVATVVMLFLIGPILESALGSSLPIPGLSAAHAAAAPHAASGGGQLAPVRLLQAWFEDARAALRSVMPTDVGVILLLGFLAVVAKNAFTYFGHYAIYRAGLAAVKDLRDLLMDRLLGQSAEFYQKQPTAVLMSRVTNDIEQITVVISDRLSDVVQDSFTVVGVLIYVLSLNLRLALTVLIGAPLFLWPILHFSEKLRRRSHQSQERLGEMNAVVDEVLKGYRVVQGFGMERFEALRFREATRRHFRANLKARKVLALNAPVVEVIGAAAVLGLLLYAGRLISAGTMSAAMFGSFIVGLYSLYTPIKRLTRINLALQGAVAAGERVFAAIDEPVAVHDAPGARDLPPIRKAIRFERVSFAYEPEKPVLRGLDVTIPAGKAVALVGPSGAGKSTVAQLLPRFWDVQEGRVAIDGADVRDVTLRSLRAQIGLVTQETVLFNTTVAANIAYGQETVDRERLRACARAAFAEEFILEFPDGYDTIIGEAGARLSGGQRQRIAVARALYKDPPILVLDEATSALDAEAEAIVQRALENLMQGRTTLVIAHRLATVRNADTIVVIDEGRAVEQGSHAELLAAGGVYAKLANMQGITE
ncbi:MAG TPA: ABC transporter transmembrane domain-containing protein [Thermoanaerobaculaceae bacterium]|nr:ABC transporter transmembrane domain-containing protein [Thermoanaerobaculaceae bacterium]